MRRTILGMAVAALAGVGAVAVAEEPAARPVPRVATQETEPPLELVVEVEGQKVDARLGEEVRVSVGGRDVSLVVRAKPERTFEAHGVAFRYPADMGFEREADEGQITWTLDGNNSVIMLTRNEEVAETTPLLDGIVRAAKAQYGPSVKTSETTLRLGGVERPARRLNVAFAGARLRQDVVVLDGRWILILQDSVDDAGRAPAEAERVRALLDTTWRQTGAGK